jgi:hypothetical protein|tara:strand:+ start:120 stop:713 length:594 start_codon:yes stop_codon:yes gene_type:complete
MKRITLFFVLTIIFSSVAFTQGKRSEHKKWVAATIDEGDTIPLVHLDFHNVKQERVFKSKRDKEKYNRLKFNVTKVYPYAKLASNLLYQYEDSIAKAESDKERKRFYKMVESDLRAEYEEELMKLTVTQGKILIKLVDRETGNSSYNLVKELRNGLTAFFWQGLARLFGNDLKTEYDAIAFDKDIEQIVASIESSIK